MSLKIAIGPLLLLGVGAVTFADPPKTTLHASPPSLRHPSAVAIRRTAPAAAATPIPGLYAAVPYLAIVVVPAETDPKFVVAPNDTRAVGRVIQPPTKLVPLRR